MENKKIISIIKLIILLSIVVTIPVYLLVNYADYIGGLQNKESFLDVVDYLDQYRTESIFIYIGLQIIQIVISVLPGQVFQMAAGYIFGFPLGLLLSIIGAALGSIIAYYLAVFLGRDALKILVKPSTLDDLVTRLNSKQAYILLFILYLIPGVPKDVIAYAAGVAHMKAKPFLLLSLLGRMPAMSASIMIGALYESEQYYWVGAIAIICIVLFVICLVFRKSINQYIDKFYEKLSK